MKITKPQQAIIDLMRGGYLLVQDTVCWKWSLQKQGESFLYMSVNKMAATNLREKGLVVKVESSFTQNCYKLAQDAK